MPLVAGQLYQKTPALSEWDSKRWPHFQPWELACNCGRKMPRFCDGEYYHDPAFLDVLERFRVRVDAPLIINSGHRCARRNEHVGGKPSSMHLIIAVDIDLREHDRWKLRDLAAAEGFRGIGHGLNFIHLDCRLEPKVWDYGPASIEAWGKAKVH